MQNALGIDQTIRERSLFLLVSRFIGCMEYVFFLQKENFFLWVPVFFACGIGLYFSLPFEPPVILSVFLVLFWFSIHVLIRPLEHKNVINKGIVYSSFAVLLVLSGIASATLRSEIVKTPMLDKKLGPVMVSGNVTYIEEMSEARGSRITLSNLSIEDLDVEKTPRHIRLQLRADKNTKIGQRIKALALLNPPSAPLFPDGFNFRRYLYFKSIGAVGFIYRQPEVLVETSDYDLLNIESLRHYIATRIKESLDTRGASIALALIVGQKSAILNEDRNAIRDAGLAHMLAISGLHVGLVASVFFFFIRLFLVMIPKCSLYYSAKKISAVLSLLVAVFYMLIAGATIPTQRAVMMIAIVFLAIILDRSPISLRLVAFSSLFVLICTPESLMSASFHMSFAAVTCLIYFYDITRKFWMGWYKKRGWYRKIVLYFISVCITTLIASFATAPFALYHFGQVSYLGSLANFVAVPLLAFFIMPFAILSLVVMPFGLEYWPLQIVGVGVGYMMDISYWASSLPASVIRIGYWGFLPFVILVLSCLFAILWKGWGKLCVLPFLVLSFAISNLQDRPDILLSSSHKLFGFKEQDGPLFVSTRRSDRFVLGNWERFYGQEKKTTLLLPNKGGSKDLTEFYVCGEDGCRFTINGRNVSFVRRSYIVDTECGWADVLISVKAVADNYKMGGNCNAELIIDKFDSWKSGAHAIWIEKSGNIKFSNVAQATSNRPWSAYSSYRKTKRY